MVRWKESSVLRFTGTYQNVSLEFGNSLGRNREEGRTVHNLAQLLDGEKTPILDLAALLLVLVAAEPAPEKNIVSLETC